MTSFGVTPLTLIAVRNEPDERSEMTTQLLLGETFTLGRHIGSWVEVTAHFDEHSGWIKRQSILEISEAQLRNDSPKKMVHLLCHARSTSPNNGALWILPGSELPGYNPSDRSFTLGERVFELEEPPPDTTTGTTREVIIRHAQTFLNAPHLWGGRSLFGIDCSGLVQMVHKLAGLTLPRDISQQVKQGRVIPFIKDAQPGDLAFFENDCSIIDHVGILMDANHLIHVSGCVRMDTIDHQGVKRPDQQEYSHRLRVIKSII